MLPVPEIIPGFTPVHLADFLDNGQSQLGGSPMVALYVEAIEQAFMMLHGCVARVSERDVPGGGLDGMVSPGWL